MFTLVGMTRLKIDFIKMYESIKDCKAISVLNRLLFIVKHYFQKVAREI